MSRQTDISLMFLVHTILSDVKPQTHHVVLFFFCVSPLDVIFVATKTHLLIVKGKIIATP